MGKILSRPQKSIQKPLGQSLLVLSPTQVREIFLCAQDPRYFIDNYLKLSSDIGVIPFHTRPYQQTQLKAFTLSNVFTLQPRQSGTTALPLAFQLWEAIFRQNTSHAAAFPNTHRAITAMEIINDWVVSLPEWLRPGVVRKSHRAIEFDNGSNIIVGLIASSLCRGRSMTTLFVDSLGHANPLDQEDFFLSSMPSMGSSGRMFISGVPNNRTDTFATLWSNISTMQNSSFVPIHILASSVYTQTALDGFRKTIGDHEFRRNYNCEFI